MSTKSEDITRLPSSPRLIPAWKDLKLLIKNTLKDVKAGGKPKDEDVRVLSDWPETVYKEFHQPQFSTFICFYSIDVNYFVSLNWMEPSTKEMKAVLWIQEGDAEMKGILKQQFHVLDQVPPIQAMVHTGPGHMLIAYCDDVCLRLFGDHQRAFTLLGTVPCHFFISCLCFDSETEVLLSGTVGAVVTWFILPNGSGLQMAQTVPMPDYEFVQGFSLNGPQGSILAFCESKVRVFTHQGQGQLKEVKQFSPLSGSPITCSFTCVPRGYFYAGNKDGEIHAWGLTQGNFLHSFQAHSSSVVCIQSRPDTHTLLTAGAEGLVKEWNLAFGNLLRQLPIHEGLRRLQFINNTTFFCQTGCAFSLHHLPYFYSLFHVCGSAPQQMQRVCCGRNWTRILCATKDGLLRFLSPVTGELLVVTWPLQVMEKAKVWAYDSAREELFVATHSPEVLVFDATRSPCPVKYLVCTSVKPGDRVRCLAYGQSRLAKGLEGLMFCGHDSGTVRILSHYSCARIEKTLHTGAVLALSTLEGPQKSPLLCSYGIDNTLYLTEAVLQENKVTLEPVMKILCGCSLKHVILLPDSVGAITENHCWRLWHFQDFMTSSRSKQTSVFQETKSLHQCAIVSFDVCFSLRLFVTAGTDGRVRLWNFQGRLLTELKSALQFGPLCFANNRGDLLLTFNHSLYLVSCLKLLRHAELTLLSTLDSADDIQEVPKPFLPSFFFSFRTVNVPKFVYLEQGLQEFRGLEALANKRVIAFDNIVPHVVEEERRVPCEIQEQPKLHFVEDKDPNLSSVDLTRARPPRTVPAQLHIAGWDGISPYYVLQKFFGKGRHWPITPDGYIPNSVIRARLWPEGTPIVLCCGVDPAYRGKDRDMDEIFKHIWLLMTTLAKKSTLLSKQRYKVTSSLQAYSVILENLTKQNWIGRQFNDEFISNLIEIILNLTTSCSVEKFKKYINILEKLFALYHIPSGLQMQAVCRLLEDTADSNPQIRALSWEGLERLGFTSHLFAVPLAMGLMDEDKNVRGKVLHHFIRVTGIESKTMLLALLRKQETLQELQQEFIGEFSLDQLLGINAENIQLLIAQFKRAGNRKNRSGRCL
ncbi:WD repeat-containing protein 87-like [Talpa occidentalis]|uniref:WD repeat-containing protein 87-like n=1 Tax=Talpa occidentalis TaxID=50954 RepID=UPI0023F78C32|nr:WD repeat-containing protein 87-like [Talpa occidentalis]